LNLWMDLYFKEFVMYYLKR